MTTPDHLSETYRDGAVSNTQANHSGVQLTHMHYEYDPDLTDTEVSNLFIYVIREGNKIRVEQDLHVTGLFPKETWIELMKECGFDVEVIHFTVDPYQVCMFVGTKRL